MMTGAPRRTPASGARERALHACRLALVTAALGVATLVAATVLVVWTKPGQRADERSRWSVAVPPEMRETIVAWLGTVSVGSIVAVLLVVLAIGAIGECQRMAHPGLGVHLHHQRWCTWGLMSSA